MKSAANVFSKDSIIRRPRAHRVTSPAARLDLADGGALVLVDRWLSAAESSAAMFALLAEVPWEQKPIIMLGKQILQPRLVAWYGDSDALYKYSGIVNFPLPWTPLLANLRDRAADAASAKFNSVLLNLYRDGSDSMGFHADKERELGRDPIIASVSLGATRRFSLRHAHAQGIDLSLTDGSLLILRGTTQHFWRHGVPKESKAVGPRINLTFRHVTRSEDC